MVNFNLSALEAFSKSASLGSSGFLSSLNSAFDGGSAGASLFNSLLTEVNADVPNLNAAATNTAAQTTQNAMDANASDPFSALQDVASAWNGFIQKWQNYQNNQSANGQSPGTTGGGTNSNGNSGSTPVSTNVSAGSPTSAADANVNNQPQIQGQTSPASATGKPVTGDASGTQTTTDTSSQGTSSDGNAPPKLSDLLAELQAILHMLQHHIQAAQGNQGTAAGSGGPAVDPLAATNTPVDPTASTTPANTSNNSGTTDPTASDSTNGQTLLPVADMIAELLLLSRFAEKKLGLDPSTQTQTTDQSSTTQPTASTDLASLDAQLRANLKTLLDSLKADVANGNGAAAQTATAAVASAATASATSDISLTTLASGASTDTPKDPSASDVVSNALALAQTFVKQIDNLFTPQANTAANASFAPVASTIGDGNQASANSNFSDNQGATLTNGASDNSANTQQVALGDGGKSTDPYSFASQLSATRAATGGTTGLPSAVEQVMFQLSRNVKSGNDQMTIQLNPADLGSVNIKLNFAGDGSVQGTVVASNPATLDLLLKDVRGLERALQDAGLSADPGSLQFSLGGQPGDTSNQTANNSSGQSSGNAPDRTTTDFRRRVKYY